jgi:hypothetical protein
VSKKHSDDPKTEGAAGRFTRDADGVIVDHQTGFRWFVLPKAYNFDEFMLVPYPPLPGDGWRSPTRAELQTLVTKVRNAEYCFLDPVFLGERHAARVWTSEFSDKPGTVWAFDFETGRAFEDWDIPTRHSGVFLVQVKE